jgi:hypothetical protein
MATPTTLPASFVAGTVLQAAQLNNLRGAFRIMQVATTTKTDTFTMSSSTFADVTGLSVSITPSSTSSLVLVAASVQGAGNTSSSSNVFVRLLRGSTVIGAGAAAGTRIPVNAVLGIADYLGFMDSASIWVLDTPATTSATTYKIQVASQSGAIAVYVNRAESDADDPTRPRASSSITVMEISA